MKFSKKMLLAGLMTASTFGLATVATDVHALPAGTTEVGTPGGGGFSLNTDTVWSGLVVLRDTVFVENGASLTIEAGTTIVSFLSEADDAGIVVTRGSQIFALGTPDQPIIATSARDVGTWTGSVVVGPADAPTDITTVGDRTTGTWELGATEWRNITVLGEGVISASDSTDAPTNPAFPSGTAAGQFAEERMEGLTAFNTDRTFYGGTNDMDDSGTIRHLSSRYGGRVVGDGVELNGISLGGLGKETELDYIEIMNNTDDGIEVWGGTADIKHFAVWNVGDDSFDFDQGWRGRAQFGLIVQGASNDADDQGSGAGDNCIEFDGAEFPDAQPRTSTSIYNVTVVGNPSVYQNYANGAVSGVPTANGGIIGDGGTAWRDGARAQFRRCIFLDVGDELIRFEDEDGGYGLNGSQTWNDVWNTNVSADPVAAGSGVNSATGDFAAGGSKDIYAFNSQFTTPGGNGKLAEIRDSVVYNLNANNYFDEEDPIVGTFFDPTATIQSAAYANVLPSGTATVADVPIQALTREAPVLATNGDVPRVTLIDPRPANQALVVRDTDLDLPLGDFWTPFPYTGAFSPDHNWAGGWTAADAYGFFPSDFEFAEPGDVSIEIAVTQTTFDADPSLSYAIECSTDGRDWTVVETISGRSGLVTVANEINVDENKIYRVVVR